MGEVGWYLGIHRASRRESLEELRKERERRPELAEVIDLELELVKIASEAPALEAPPIAKGEAQALLEKGIPLLEGLEYEEAVKASSEFVCLFRRVCQVVARHRPELADRLACFAELELSSIEEVELADGEEEELFDWLLNRSLRPFLLREARRLVELVEGSYWYRPRCPICGGEPDLAHLEREGGARELICARCDTVWAYRRVGCPFCGADGPEKWGYYVGKGGRRLYTCEECRRYLKILDLREGWREQPPPVERVLTLEMDLAARERGYG